MEGKNWGELEKYKCKLENTCNKLLISLKKTNKQRKKLQAIKDELNEI